MTRTLVLGASGFLGRHVVRRLIKEGRSEAVCVSRRPPTEHPDGGVSWLQCDLTACSRADLAELLAEVRPAAVLNCAGATHASIEELRAVNVRFVHNLVGVLSAYRSATLVHLGSAAEFGRQPHGVAIGEESPLCPVTEYGRTKALGTLLVRSALDSGELSGAVLRVFDPIGRGSPPSSVAGAVAGLLRAAVCAGEDSLRLGYLGDARDFLDARDVAAAVTARAEAGAGGPAVLNVGSGRATLVRTLVQRLAEIADYRGRIEESLSGSSVSTVPWQQANIARARRYLGWSPVHSLDDALRELWHGTAIDGGLRTVETASC